MDIGVVSLDVLERFLGIMVSGPTEKLSRRARGCRLACDATGDSDTLTAADGGVCLPLEQVANFKGRLACGVSFGRGSSLRPRASSGLGFGKV